MNLPRSQSPGLAEAVLPLLESLGWQGNTVTLAEYLPMVPGWDVRDLMEHLDEVGFRGKARRFRLGRADAGPSLVCDRRGTFACLNREGPGYRLYSAEEGSWVVQTAQQVRSRFRGGWTWSFEPAPGDPASQTGPYWIQEFVSQNRGALGGALLYSLVLAGFGILSPQFIGLLYQEITSMRSSSSLISLGLGALLFAGGEVMFITLRQTLLSRMKDEVTRTLGRQVLSRILSFPLVMGLNLEPSTQYTRIREFENLADLLSRPVFRSMIDLPFMTVLLVFLGLTGGAMVLVPLVTIGVFLLAGLFAHPLLKKLEQESLVQGQRVQEGLEVLLEKGRELRLLGLVSHWKAQGEQSEREAVPPLLDKGRHSAFFQYFGSATVSLAGIGAVLVGIGEVQAGSLQPGSLMASMMLVWRILDPFRSIFVLLGSLESASQTLSRLGKFMAIPGEARLDPSRPALHLPDPSVRVDSLYFKYPTSPRFALANVGMSVPAFGSLHVGGPAGSGKSTLVLALLGLIEGSSGRVLVGGQNIRQYHSVTYRRAVAHLPPRVPVLPTSLRDNLKLARADATDDELLEALSAVGLSPLVNDLSEGLETPLDDRFRPPTPDFFRGLGIARLLLRPSRLWILDGPEQGLGADLRGRFLDLLVGRRGQITLLMFGNDPEFSALADHQAWFDQGRLVQEVP